MTKRIRVENADTSTYKVVVEVWDKGHDNEPDKLAQEIKLDNPCDMTGMHLYITSTRYLVVKESE